MDNIIKTPEELDKMFSENKMYTEIGIIATEFPNITVELKEAPEEIKKVGQSVVLHINAPESVKQKALESFYERIADVQRKYYPEDRDSDTDV